MDTKEKIANRIKTLRKSKGWTQEDLALNSGVSQSTLSEVESSKAFITIPTLEKLCIALGITTEQFFDYKNGYNTNFETLMEQLIFECNYLPEKDIKNLIGFAKVMRE